MMTREEIKAVYDQGPEAVIALIEQLCMQIGQLSARVKELEDRLATNSRASHKPPSSDSFVKQMRSLRAPSTRKSGGQRGHPGATLEQVAEPVVMPAGIAGIQFAWMRGVCYVLVARIPVFPAGMTDL
jgi:hypothetical protein